MTEVHTGEMHTYKSNVNTRTKIGVRVLGTLCRPYAYLFRLQARIGTALGRRGISPALGGQNLVRYLTADLAGFYVAANVLVHIAATCCKI